MRYSNKYYVFAILVISYSSSRETDFILLSSLYLSVIFIEIEFTVLHNLHFINYSSYRGTVSLQYYIICISEVSCSNGRESVTCIHAYKYTCIHRNRVYLKCDSVNNFRCYTCETHHNETTKLIAK